MPRARLDADRACPACTSPLVEYYVVDGWGSWKPPGGSSLGSVTITLANHIAAWAGKGMPMGTFYEVSMTVEGYQSSGTADVKFTMK
jgi:endo-1,4-beta-xylanase